MRIRQFTMLALAGSIGAFAVSAQADLDQYLPSGQKLTSDLNPGTEFERFRVDLPGQSRLTFNVAVQKKNSVAWTKNAKVHVTFSDASGNIVKQYTGRSAHLGNFEVPASGVYTIDVESADDSPLTYKLQVAWKAKKNWGTRKPVINLIPGVPVKYPFTAEQNSDVVFNTHTPANSDAQPEVTSVSGPDGFEVELGGSTNVDFVAPTSGNYTATLVNTGTVGGNVGMTGVVLVPAIPVGPLNLTGPNNNPAPVVTDGVQSVTVTAQGAGITCVIPGLEKTRIGVPAGALSAGVIVSVSKSIGLIPLDPNMQTIGPAVNVQPSGVIANSQMNVRIPFTPIAPGDPVPVISVLVRQGTVYSTVPTTLTIDSENGTVEFSTPEFGEFAVMAPIPATTPEE